MYNGNEKSIEVVLEHPAINRTPKQLCAIKFLQKKRIRAHSGLYNIWTLPQIVKLTMFLPLSSLLESHLRTLSPTLKSEALVLLSNYLFMPSCTLTALL